MSTHNNYTTYHALGKLSMLEKGPMVTKSRNLKNDGYDKKAPTGCNYGIQ
jgi:hypothetical protein